MNNNWEEGEEGKKKENAPGNVCLYGGCWCYYCVTDLPSSGERSDTTFDFSEKMFDM